MRLGLLSVESSLERRAQGRASSHPAPHRSCSDNPFGSQRGGAAGCQSDSSNGDGLASGSKRRCNEEADRLCRTSVRNLLAGRNDRAPFQ